MECLPTVMATGGVKLTGVGRFLTVLMTLRDVGGCEGVRGDDCTWVMIEVLGGGV